MTAHVLGGPATDRLLDVARRAKPGEVFTLEELDAFPWDEVTLFGDGSELAAINRLVGRELFEADGRLWGQGGLLVFRLDGKVVHATMFPPPLRVLAVDGHWYRRSTSVAVASRAGTPPWLLLRDGREDAP